ncbi:metal-dependent hydrolase [Candidatus Woesearchaeota archaeon]|nr:metal-dependent hydrolase [Candidatus Woesearchaeota archaeon]
MMFKTHLMFSLLVSSLIFKYFSLNPYLFVLILVLAGSLPDIDHTKSRIGRKLFIISWIINFFFGHRRLIHSIIFASILSLVIKMVFNEYWIPFYIGYLSHLFLDVLTKQGLYIFYPSNFKLDGFIKTNGLFEKVFLFILFVLNVYLIIKLL